MARCAFVTIVLAFALFCVVAPTSGDKCAPPSSDPADHTFCSRRYFTMPRVQYGGPLSQSLDAFHWYNPAQLFDGKSLQDYFRFSVVWWHTFLGDGRDIFGGGSKNFPWHAAADPMQRARDTVDAAFELFEVLGVKFYAFHDRDVAPTAFLPDGRIDLDATNANLMEIVRYMKTKQEQTGVKVLWGTANLFSHRVYKDGAATNPDFSVLTHAAWQVKQALEATHFLGGANYVLWGGREGYYSLLNTRMDKEKQHLASFLKAVADHADSIGFTGKLLIEPKPCEPTLHQYDTDVDTVLAFLRRYDLDQRFFLNIEENHATLAGKTFMHELRSAAESGGKPGNSKGFLINIDANSGGPKIGLPRRGWDSDLFPGVYEAIEGMLVVEEMGGFTSGGVNFDAKTHRTSTDLNDIVRAHILGMDSYAAALFIARAFNRDPRMTKILSERYASFETRAGFEFESNKLTLVQLASIAKEQGEPALRSGHLEAIEKILQEHILMAGYYALKDSVQTTAAPGHSVNPFALHGKFPVADTDKNGRVSVLEMAVFLAAHDAGATVDGILVRLLHADLNKDDTVSTEEYQQFANCKNFDEGGNCVTKVYQTM